MKIAYISAEITAKMDGKFEDVSEYVLNHPKVELYTLEDFCDAFNSEDISDLGYITLKIDPKKEDKLHLTMNILNNVEKGIILATGLAKDNSSGLNMSNSGKLLRWVLKLGTIGDWCIYTHYKEYNVHTVAQTGDKVFGKENILNVIKIDDSDVWERMRI